MKYSVYMEEMDAFTYREKIAGDAIVFIPVGALEQHGSHMAMCVDAALTKKMPGTTAEALEAETNGAVHGIVTAAINYGYRSQQRSGGGIGKAAYQIGHLPAPVGEYLRQQEGDPALHEWLGEPIQTLCHAALPPLKEKSAPLYRAAVRGAMPFRLRKGGSRKMHKKYYLSCGKVLWAGRKKALTGMEKTVIIFFKYIKIGGMRSKVGGAYEKGISGAAGRPGV